MDKSPVWNQQNDEPDQWYQRFQVYLHLGASRSIDQSYRHTIDTDRIKSARSTHEPKRASSQWRVISKKWNWESRALSWDQASLQPLHEQLQTTRVARVDIQIATETEYAARERKLRDRAMTWVEDYIFGRVEQVRTTEKEGFGSEGEAICEKTTSTTPLQPPQWMLERFIGRRDYATQFNVLMDLLKSIMSIEDDSEGVQQVKGMIHASLEGLLLESGVDEVRTLLKRGHS